jgi:hypothetical protein
MFGTGEEFPLMRAFEDQLGHPVKSKTSKLVGTIDSEQSGTKPEALTGKK